MDDRTCPGARWKAVVGWEGFYEVSESGQVRSVARIVVRSNGHPQTVRERIMRRDTGKYGHCYVTLARQGIGKKFLVHRLVLEAFVGPCPDGLEGCHNDGNAENNRLSNLRWDTPSSNNLDRTKHGTNLNANRAVCPYGHQLVAPNLVAYKLKEGRRSCKACQSAHQIKLRRSRNGLPCDDFQELSDARYRWLMRESNDYHMVAEITDRTSPA